MNSLSYYHRREEPWTNEEDIQLRVEYVDNQQDIMQIADAHYKTPGQIASRLKTLKITNTYYKDIRGFDIFQQAPLYAEIMRDNKMKREARSQKKEEKKEENKPTRTNKSMLHMFLEQQQTQIDNSKELLVEIKELRTDMKEILRLMTAVYDFEVQK